MPRRRATRVTETALVIGEALVDVVVRHDGEVATLPGGSPANVALGLARLGRDTELLTALGDDAHGAIVREHLASSGARLVPASPSPRTSVATARLDAAGVATYEFELTWDLAPDATPSDSPVVVHAGSIAAVLDPGARAVVAALEAAKAAGATITYDPNARPALMGTPDLARPLVERCVALADVVKVSDEDLAWLAPGEEPLEVAAAWRSLGPSIVVVTLGSEGAIAFASCGIVSVPPVTVQVADTVGAGDSFMSGLIDGLWSADALGPHGRETLAHIDEPTLRKVLERCARIAGITVSRPGANPPTREELGETA